MCQKLHPQTNFSAREIQHKYIMRHKPMCLDCMHPACSNPQCQTCKACRNPKCKEGSNCEKEPEPLVGAALSMLKKTKLCSACRNDILMYCSDCGKLVDEERTNKSSRNKLVKCYDCLHPPCSVTACNTCKICRNVTCESSDCKQKPTALKPKELAVFKDKSKYVCQRCLLPSCARCTAEMPKTTRERRRKNESWMDPAQQRVWTCTDCEARENFRKRKP